MRRKNKQLLAWLMTLVMCFATLAPAMIVSAEENSRTIIAQETFESGSINTSPNEAPVVAAGGFWFGSGKSTYTLDGGTLKYTDRHSSDLTDIRFYYDGQETERAMLQDDFTLSFRLKPLINSLDMWINWTQHDYASVSYEDGVRLSAGVLSGRGITDRTIAKVPLNQWSVIEVYFEYDETAEAFYKQNGTVYKTGETGAFTSYTVRLNGMDMGTAELGTANEIKNAFHCIDFIRLFQGATGNYELDDLTLITGAAPYSTNWDQSQEDYNNNTKVFYNDKTPATNYAYSLAVVGDTQIVCYNDANYGQNGMDTIYQWIVDNKESKNIQYVLGVGDVTQSQNNAKEFALAKNAIDKMNGVVPYTLARGNHDNTSNFNATFDTVAYTSQFDGFYSEDKIENAYKLMTIGDTKYLFITLDYGPEDEVLDWAGELCATHPDHKVIITTHAYLYADGTTIDTDDVCDPITMNKRENNGETMWNKLGRKYENIFMIISGHECSDSVLVTEAEGDNGNIVTQMLVDFQGVDSDYGYGSVGVVTMLYFSEDGKQVEVEAYSPIKQAYFREDNQFTFDIEKTKTIVYHDFENVTIDTAGGYGSFGTVATNGGLGMSASGTAENGQLNLSFAYGNLLDLQLFNCGYADTIKENFVLSFDIQLGSSTTSYGTIMFQDNGGSGGSESPISINGGKIHISGANAELSTTKMTHVEIQFNYDDATEAFTSFTLIVGGKKIGTVAISASLKYIDHFRMFHYWGSDPATMILDNIYVGYGKDIAGTVIYGSDFEDMTTVPNQSLDSSNDGFRLMNALDTDKGGTSSVANGIVKAQGPATAGRGFIDVVMSQNKLGATVLEEKNVTISMRIRPVGKMPNNIIAIFPNNENVVQFYYDSNAGTNMVRVVGGSKSVALSPYRFTSVELMASYDDSLMMYTKIHLYVNGEYVDTKDITDCTQITLLRMFDGSWSSTQGVEIDEFFITTGCTTTYKGETSVTEFIGYQTTAIENDAFNLRLISIMTDADLSKYDYVGYKVTASFLYNGETVEMVLPDNLSRCNKVFTSVLATDEMAVADVITAETLGGQYIFAVNCIGVPSNCGEIDFNVTTYYKLAGQDAVDERTINFTVDPTANANQGGVN